MDACNDDEACPRSAPESKRSLSSLEPEGSYAGGSESSTKLYRRVFREGRTEDDRTDRKKLVRERVTGTSMGVVGSTVVAGARELSPALQAFMYVVRSSSQQ